MVEASTFEVEEPPSEVVMARRTTSGFQMGFSGTGRLLMGLGMLMLLGAIFFLVGVARSESSKEPLPPPAEPLAVPAPELCFEDGECVNLLRYRATHEQRSKWEAWCEAFKGKRGLKKCPRILEQMRSEFPSSAAFAEDLAAVNLYVYSVLQIGPNQVMRKAKGKNLPVDLKIPVQLIASGMFVLRANASIQQYKRPIVFRGETDDVPHPLCAAYSARPAAVFDNPISTGWGFDSTSLDMAEAVDFASYGGVLKIIRQRSDIGTYIWPIGIAHQYEVLMPPMLSYRTLACEQRNITSMFFRDRTYNVALQYMVDVTSDAQLSPEEEARELAEMKAEVERQLRGCWPFKCEQSHGKCTNQTADHDYNTMVEDSVCEQSPEKKFA